MKRIDFRKNVFVIGCVVYVSFFAACGSTKEGTNCYEFDPGEDYSLIWSDEFEGDSLDETKWSYQLGDGSDYGISGWGNRELQVYTDSAQNVSVSDGNLKITALKGKLPNGATGFTSARIRTIKDDNEVLFSTTFGRVEAKIKMDVGPGIWPAFWMLPADPSIYGKWAASGEIDIMEVRGRVPEVSTGTAHFGRTWPGNVYQGSEYTFPEGTDVKEYHVYAVEWEPEEIRWYIDDNCFYTLSSWYAKNSAYATEFTNPAPFDVPFYILLNVAVGGNFDPDAIINDDSFPGSMTVDYVRVYHKNEGYKALLDCANSKGKEVEDGTKEPLHSKNSIYNGTFDQGINHVAYWKMEGLEASVDSMDLKRRLWLKTANEPNPRLYQTGLCLDEGSIYGVRVDTCSDAPSSITIIVYDDSEEIILEEQCSVNVGDNNIIAFKFENETNCKNALFELIFENNTEISVDNIMLMRLEP